MRRLTTLLWLVLQLVLLATWAVADQPSIEQVVRIEVAAARLDVRADILRLEVVAACPDSARAAVNLARQIITELQQATKEERPVIASWLETKVKLPQGALPHSEPSIGHQASGKWWQGILETAATLWLLARLR